MDAEWSNADTTAPQGLPFVAPEATMVIFGTFTNGSRAFNMTLRGFDEPTMANNLSTVSQWLILVAHMEQLGYKVISR